MRPFPSRQGRCSYHPGLLVYPRHHRSPSGARLAALPTLQCGTGQHQRARQHLAPARPLTVPITAEVTIALATGAALTTAEAAVCAAVAAAAGLAFVALVKRSYRLKGSTYSYNFRENCDLTIPGRVDDYIRTTTTQADGSYRFDGLPEGTSLALQIDREKAEALGVSFDEINQTQVQFSRVACQEACQQFVGVTQA